MFSSIKSLEAAAVWVCLLMGAVAPVLSSCAIGESLANHEPTEMLKATGGAEVGLGPEDADGSGLEIYAREDWYLDRAEPEKSWRGVLAPREIVQGPGARQALVYELIADEGSVAVYAANAQDQLEPFLGREVLIRGKLVDLREEGFGEELWIASIKVLDAEEE